MPAFQRPRRIAADALAFGDVARHARAGRQPGACADGEMIADADLAADDHAGTAAGELAETDLVDARTYLTGSFPLRLTSNDQVAKMLSSMLVHDLGRDFIERRNGLIDAVTLADLRRVSARLFSGELLVSVVGDPAGL